MHATIRGMVEAVRMDEPPLFALALISTDGNQAPLWRCAFGRKPGPFKGPGLAAGETPRRHWIERLGNEAAELLIAHRGGAQGRAGSQPFEVLGLRIERHVRAGKDLGLEVIQKRITRDEVYISDEAFFTGTAAEITPIRELDNRRIGAGQRGPITTRLQSLFFDCVNGRVPEHEDWLSYV